MKLIIIDTGCANLASVKFAIKRLNITPTISDNADEILSADKLILPGVGTAEFAINEINKKGFVWECNYWANTPPRVKTIKSIP